MIEFLVLSIVVIDHINFAEIEFGKFGALVVLVKTAETLPF